MSASSSTATLASVADTKTRPTYAATFHCIGSACEDTCCGEDWDIPVDKKTYEKYQHLPFGNYGSSVSQYVSITTPPAHENLYAYIKRDASGLCPFFGKDHFCGIQKTYGSGLLSATCSIYPRSLNQVDGLLEGSLSLSCPEAARNVLLAPDSTQIAGDLYSGEFRTDNVCLLATSGKGFGRKPHAFFHAIRALLIDMVQDHSRPLWKRLLLIGSFCKRLDEIATHDSDEVVSAIIQNYRRILVSDWLDANLEGMPAQPRLRLDVIISLSMERARDTTYRQRFRETFWSFIEGIGSPAGSPSGDDIQRFLDAEEKYHRPFFESRPFILENYLLNYMFQNLFPFGREGSSDFTPRSIFDEYILMTIQFSWINTLLIGITANCREAFAEEHVVRTVQSFTRAIEHYPHALASINACMRSRRMDNLHGMAIMLKN